MIKYLGAFMILLSGLSLGLGRVMEGRRRIGTLRSVLAALELMQGELGANAAPLPELCTALCRRASPPAEDFFQTLNASLDRLGEEDFAALWGRAAEKELFALKNGELEEIKALGNIIGRYSFVSGSGAGRISGREKAWAYASNGAERAAGAGPVIRRRHGC